MSDTDAKKNYSSESTDRASAPKTGRVLRVSLSEFAGMLERDEIDRTVPMKVTVPPAEFPADGHPRTLAESWMHGPRWDLAVAAYEQLSRNSAEPDRINELPIVCNTAAFTVEEREAAWTH